MGPGCVAGGGSSGSTASKVIASLLSQTVVPVGCCIITSSADVVVISRNHSSACTSICCGVRLLACLYYVLYRDSSYLVLEQGDRVAIRARVLYSPCMHRGRSAPLSFSSYAKEKLPSTATFDWTGKLQQLILVIDIRRNLQIPVAQDNGRNPVCAGVKDGEADDNRSSTGAVRGASYVMLARESILPPRPFKGFRTPCFIYGRH